MDYNAERICQYLDVPHAFSSKGLIDEHVFLAILAIELAHGVPYVGWRKEWVGNES